MNAAIAAPADAISCLAGPAALAQSDAELPRHFGDSRRAMDLEWRLVKGRMSLQGRIEVEAMHPPFGSHDSRSRWSLRCGHNGILTEAQVRDVTALLPDPATPTNQ